MSLEKEVRWMYLKLTGLLLAATFFTFFSGDSCPSRKETLKPKTESIMVLPYKEDDSKIRQYRDYRLIPHNL